MNLSSLVGHVTELLLAIQNSKEPADHIVSSFFRNRTYLGSRDRRFISEAVYGIIRNRRFLEALLEQFLSEHPDASDLDQPLKRFLPLYAIYAVAVENKSQTDALPESLWNTSFPSVRLQMFEEWIHSHKNLEYLRETPEVMLAVRYSFQDWMVERWNSGDVGETERLLRALNSAAEITLRVNRLKANREECQRRLANEGIATTFTTYSPDGLIASKRFNTHASQAFKDGWYEVQDEGSQLISILASPNPGQIVVDACAGAGGKTLHLASLMNDQGEIIAMDNDSRRLFELERRAERAGISSIKTLNKENILPENFFGKADLVLVDAPCSGVGTIRRNPSMKWSVTESLVEHYHERQSEILGFNAQFVKPGGKLVYATCSLFRRENEDVVNKFLMTNDQFKITSLQSPADVINLPSESEMLTLYPHITHTDGFFISAMLKR